MPTYLSVIIGAIAAIAVVWFIIWRIRKHNDYKRMMNLVFLRIRLPRKESKEDTEREREQYSAQKNFKEITAVMTHFYESLHGMLRDEVVYFFKGQDFLSLELAAYDRQIHFYIVIPRNLVSFVEKQITSFYPDAVIEKVPDYNIFRPNSCAAGSYIRLKKKWMYPIKTFQRMHSDPLNNLVNALSKLEDDEGAAIQMIIRPVPDGWQKKGRKYAEKIYGKKTIEMAWWNPLSWIAAFFDMLFRHETKPQMEQQGRTTPMTDEETKALEEKNSKPGYNCVIRVVASSPIKREAIDNLHNIRDAFGQYDAPNQNELLYTRWHNDRFLISNFIFRRPVRNWLQWLNTRRMLLCSEEVASIFHLPSIRYNQNPMISWQNYKIAPAPPHMPTEGILLGYNTYRGTVKEIRIKQEDRFRHFYVVGQTGTGKSSLLQVLARQDLKNGDGFAIIDPHGSLVEDILPFIPRERADDVIYFNPGDMERPVGINLLEGDTWEEKEFIAMEAMNIMVKLFGEEIFGPRIQDYFRNGCLTLMSDPEGGAITDMVRLFTDDDFARYKIEKVTNPIVQSFWKHQMAKTGMREKQEMIPYFAAKFGQFVTNTMMRNIIGQTKSSFNLFDAMQEGKIVLINLSKGETGEINSKLLGMVLVAKIQMAAMKRQKLPKEQRRNFFLYIDEFQNYVTDSIETILSEARKYRLALIIAHQYLAQLEDKGGELSRKRATVKEAVFGNVGSMMAYKIGAQDAEYLAKEFAPVFSDQDLINMDKFKGVCKLSIDMQPCRPFSLTPVNPYLEKGDFEAAEAYKQLSRLKYGRDREFVDREIIRRIGSDVS
ncbi:type IV secretion system DNA-binding domain-containing protein [Candidatus Peregrinibacteria bacterium]|nr:type IV secretion system DNA-binding domain-containing protein [Candidatus Peregrinibacteria bacterium]